MTITVNLTERVGDEVVSTPLNNAVFEGGEPAVRGLVTFTLDGVDMTGRVIAVDPSGVTVERIDNAILTENSGITFTGEPPHAVPNMDSVDPAHSQPR